ncbi:MAG TPA: group III truncated hemoglobin [Flavobacteriales bacterium]|nr:group III truncated hemoglobin [Flavobacteriales bacterium]
MNKKDITTRAGIETMVKRQYELLLANEITRDIFAGLDLEKHLPNIFDFWEMVVLGTPMVYTRNAFLPHTKLGLKKEHFETWIACITQAVDENFEGPNAKKVTDHSKLMAAIFQSKMDIG